MRITNDHARVASMMRAEMALYLDESWRFEFDRAVKRLGACHFGTRKLTLSAPLTRDIDEAILLNVIRHEIAHALAGRGAGHGAEWRRLAIRLGCTGDRCYSAGDVVPVPAPYVGKCPGCPREIHRHRLNHRQASSCAACSGGSYNENYRIVWERR